MVDLETPLPTFGEPLLGRGDFAGYRSPGKAWHKDPNAQAALGSPTSIGQGEAPGVAKQGNGVDAEGAAKKAKADAKKEL